MMGGGSRDNEMASRVLEVRDSVPGANSLPSLIDSQYFGWNESWRDGQQWLNEDATIACKKQIMSVDG